MSAACLVPLGDLVCQQHPITAALGLCAGADRLCCAGCAFSGWQESTTPARMCVVPVTDAPLLILPPSTGMIRLWHDEVMTYRCTSPALQRVLALPSSSYRMGVCCKNSATNARPAPLRVHACHVSNRGPVHATSPSGGTYRICTSLIHEAALY